MRLVLLSVFLAGCAANTWDKSGPGKVNLQLDLDQCEAQARPTPKGPLLQPVFNDCMRDKGWTRVKG